MKRFLVLIALVYLSGHLALGQDKLESASPESRIAEIQAALKAQGFDGWLFYDFRGSDILAPRILKTERLSGSRRWFYFVPRQGEPVKVVHAIEPGQLDCAQPGVGGEDEHRAHLRAGRGECDRQVVLLDGPRQVSGDAGQGE